MRARRIPNVGLPTRQCRNVSGKGTVWSASCDYFMRVDTICSHIVLLFYTYTLKQVSSEFTRLQAHQSYAERIKAIRLPRITQKFNSLNSIPIVPINHFSYSAHSAAQFCIRPKWIHKPSACRFQGFANVPRIAQDRATKWFLSIIT